MNCVIEILFQTCQNVKNLKNNTKYCFRGSNEKKPFTSLTKFYGP